MNIEESLPARGRGHKNGNEYQKNTGLLKRIQVSFFDSPFRT
jgi:hypothetical protein